MNYSDQELQLFNDGMTLTADQLVLSRIKVNEDNDEDDDDEDDEETTTRSAYRFSTDLYATECGDDNDTGLIHFRLFDGTSEDEDPFVKIDGKAIREITVGFWQITVGENDECFRYENEIEFIYSDGKTEKIPNPSDLGSLNLILASKILFIDIFRFINNKEDHSFALGK